MTAYLEDKCTTHFLFAIPQKIPVIPRGLAPQNISKLMTLDNFFSEIWLQVEDNENMRYVYLSFRTCLFCYHTQEIVCNGDEVNIFPFSFF